MRHVLGGLLWVLLLAPSLVCCQTCTYNDTVLTGSTFEFAALADGCLNDVPMFKQQGALYSLPELRVVANTTVTFNITFATVNFAVAIAFGLTLSPSSVTVSSGDALGLTPTADSVSAGACRVFPETDMINNTFAHNYTREQYTAQPCVLTWQVPLPNANNNYSYFVHDSTYSTPPRRIYIVNSTYVPSSSSSSAAASSSSSSSSSAAPGQSSSSSASSSGSSLPVSSSTSGTGTGSSSTPTLGPGSSSSSSGSGTGTGTGSGSSPSLSSGSIGTSSSSSSSPNGAGASVNAVYGAVAVVLAVIVTMVSA